MHSMQQGPQPRMASAEQFRRLVQAVKDYAIFLLDPQGRVVSWNAGAERIKGWSSGEILGQEFSRFYEPDDIAAGLPKEMLARAARPGTLPGARLAGPQGRPPLLRPGDHHRPVRQGPAGRVRQDHPGRD